MNSPRPQGPSEMAALGSRILSEADYAIVGVQAAQAGLDQVQISNLMGLIERSAMAAAQTAARQTAMAVLPGLLDLVRSTHVATAQRIEATLARQTAGWGGQTMHRRCVEIARYEATRPAAGAHY